MATTNLTEQEQLFIAKCVELRNIYKAAEVAGYSRGHAWRLYNRLEPHVTKELQRKLTMLQLNAVGVLEDTMGGNATDPKQEVRLKAAQDVLDRGGIVKRTSVSVEGSQLPAVMLLPPVNPIIPPQSK